MSALDVQVDGDHYKTMKMQPVELAYMVNGSPCFCKLAKYLTREKGDKLINLQKAKHCIELERDLVGNDKGAYAFIAKVNPDKVINEFSNNRLIYNALMSMYNRQYEEAILSVDEIISEYGESKDG